VSLIDTGSGHVMLAFQTEQRRAEMLAEHQALREAQDEAPMQPAELHGILEQVRAQGWWQGDSQQAFGVIDISMPVRGPQGQALAVLTCPFIRRPDRSLETDLQAARDQLAQAAAALSIR